MAFPFANPPIVIEPDAEPESTDQPANDGGSVPMFTAMHLAAVTLFVVALTLILIGGEMLQRGLGILLLGIGLFGIAFALASAE